MYFSAQQASCLRDSANASQNAHPREVTEDSIAQRSMAQNGSGATGTRSGEGDLLSRNVGARGVATGDEWVQGGIVQQLEVSQYTHPSGVPTTTGVDAQRSSCATNPHIPP